MAPNFFRSHAAFYLLFVASGFAGLIYESVWTHYLKLYLGHAAYAQSLVLIVFMGGMALGSALCARVSTCIRHPLLAYAAIEAAIGACALVFHELFVAATGWSYATLLPALGLDWLALAAKLAVACALILPQSVLLGATFPLMSAGLVRARSAGSQPALGEPVAMLYFANSLGAAAGVLASGFVLIAWVGLPGTLRTAGLINLALAAAVAVLARPAGAAPPLADRGAQAGQSARLLLAVALLTGFASFIYEICWIRMLSLVLGASTHAFELMLSTFILGLALGGLAVRRLVDRAADPVRLLGWVQVAMGLAALATLPVYDFSFELMEALMKGLARTETGYLFFNLAGQGIAALVMLPATFLAGMTLPLITGALLRGGTGERAIGQVYAANTLGAILGVLAAVHLGLPLLGLKDTLMFGALVDAIVGLALLYRFAPGGASRRPFAASAAACLLAFLPLALFFQLNPNKMTAGVFRHGELAGSATAKILFNQDGKTATVHLVAYDEVLSIRTNGKSDGSINMDRAGARGSDEITMVLTGAIPLALKPEAKSAAVIGIGTGLTMHALLQNLALERVETVEIEAAMAQAARGFAPRNSSAFADPRGAILIDDAKTFFSTRNRRYDILVSEPSNPWVSGVSSLFTREFYQRIRTHLNPGGVLVQWFQLYEIDASLLASVMRALGESFPHYAVYAPSDHDLLIVASGQPLPAAGAHIFAQPTLAQELRQVHVHVAGDLDARYLGSRATLEPLFESYGMPVNSDYYPVLDLNAARYRFMDRSAADVVALLNAAVPVLEMLEPGLQRRPVNRALAGAGSFERIENTRLARYARDFLLDAVAPEPEAVSTLLQKDLEISKLRLIECRQPREQDVWLHSLQNVARSVNPYLPPGEAAAVWARIMSAPCYGALREFQRRWIALFAAVAARDAASSAALAGELLATQADLHREAREYLVVAGMTGYLASGKAAQARAIWANYESELRGGGKPLLRLLRCHAEHGADKEANAAACAAAFAAYAG